jgi:hypothetical protein
VYTYNQQGTRGTTRRARRLQSIASSARLVPPSVLPLGIGAAAACRCGASRQSCSVLCIIGNLGDVPERAWQWQRRIGWPGRNVPLDWGSELWNWEVSAFESADGIRVAKTRSGRAFDDDDVLAEAYLHAAARCC